MKLASVVLAMLGLVLAHRAPAGTPPAGNSPDYKLDPAVVAGLKTGDKVAVNLSVGFDANRPVYLPKDFTSQPHGMPVVRSLPGR